jgi:integrase
MEMAKPGMLTEAKVRNAKAKDRPLKMPDGRGLYLYVTPAGSRSWRYRYESDGKEQTLTIGQYPEIGLAAAREARDRAASAKRSGRDPKTARAEILQTFEQVARVWHADHKDGWTERHANDVIHTLTRDVFPAFGRVAISAVTVQDVHGVLRAIQDRPAIETAHRVRQRISAVFVHAIAAGLCSDDPAAVIKGALPAVKHKRQPAVTDVDGIRSVLAAAEAVPAHPITRLGLRLLALTAVRPGELRGARPGEFDLDGAIWQIPAERMKMKRPHDVPLSRQAIEVVRAATRLIGRGPLLFPSSRHAHRPMSENALGYLLNRAGYHGQHVPHGFRAAFSSIMNERFPADRVVIDLMLAHVQKGVEAAYNRAVHMDRRRALAQEWADLLLAAAMPVEDLLTLPRRPSPS